MDEIGSLDLNWAVGYDGSDASFVTKDTVCFQCGNNLKFVKGQDEMHLFPGPPDGIGVLAVHGINKVFAIADQSFEPKIHVYGYPNFNKISLLEGGAELEFVFLTFSTSDYLASISGIPDYALTIWRYTTGERLCTANISHVEPTSMGFNPANWRQICFTAETELSIWNIEQSDNSFIIHKQKVPLPAVDGMIDDGIYDRDIPTRASTRVSGMTIELPMSSIAGVRGEEAEKFQEYQDTSERARPLTHVWTPAGDILVGCAGGQLIKVDLELNGTQILYNPGPYARASLSKESTAITFGAGVGSASREPSRMDAGGRSTSVTDSMLSEGAIMALALHKEGLFAASDDGSIRQIEITQQDKLIIKHTISLGVPITSLNFNPPHNTLAIGSTKGALYLYDMNSSSTELEPIFDDHYGSFIGIDMLCPGTEHIVSVRDDGQVQIWDAETGKQLGCLAIGVQATAFASSLLVHVAAIGTANGNIYYVDCNKFDNLRIIQRTRIHSGPVRKLTYNQSGRLLFSGSDDGNLVVIDARPSKMFEPVGYIVVPGMIMDISPLNDKMENSTRVVVMSNASDKPYLGATKLTYFELPPNVQDDPEKYHASLKYDFNDEDVNLMIFNLPGSSFGGCLTTENVVYTLSQTNKKLQRLKLPDAPPTKENGPDSFLEVLAEYPGHQLPGGHIYQSPHQKWLATCSKDGTFSVGLIGKMDGNSICMSAHSYQSGGVEKAVFSPDGTRLYTIGEEGVLNCYKWNFSQSGLVQAKEAVDFSRDLRTSLLGDQKQEDAQMENFPEWSPSSATPFTQPPSTMEKADKEALEKEMAIEAALEKGDIYFSPTPAPAADATWIEGKEMMAIQEEDKQYSEVKSDLRNEIMNMRKRLQAMMAENEEVPAIEKLDPHEFDLDVEEQARLQAEGDAEVQRIREEKEYENLTKAYLTDLIKTECWDNMVTKGRGIAAFNSPLECHNYPMRERSVKEKKKLEEVKNQRQVEIAELAARKEFADITQKSNNNPRGIVAPPMSRYLPADIQAENEDDLNDPDEEQTGEQPSTTGGLSAEYGGGSDLFYSQFELNVREQKVNQVVLIEDAIYRIKQTFNTKFDEVMEKKVQEISKMKERNRRIRKIMEDLELHEDIYEPSLGVIEKPELLLVVEDNEVKLPFDEDKDVKVEKFLTPEQRKKAEEEKRMEEERRQREQGDNWRERGLKEMMGGVLEIKKEDELKKDVPLPTFMAIKSETEYTEEEKKIVAEFERRVKELEEERDKYRKQLEMELKKLQTQILEGTQSFDDVLQQLFNRKVKTEMVIYQEELKILRLKYSLLLEEELNNRETELNELLTFKKQMKQLSTQAVLESRKQVDAYREQYDILFAEDKVMDKAFKREFHDVTALQVDQLNKLFRRRPKGQRGRAAADTPIYDASSGNPFSERPSTARQSNQAKASLETALADLDRESNMPEGVELHVWERMCAYRRQKIESEQLVRQKALILADMQAFLQKRQEEDEKLRQEIEDLITAANRLKEERLRFTCNLEVQLLLKQGQVEVDSGPFIHDYRDSILIHRSVVEELNGKIRHFGESKIASMVESKDFRKSIVQLEWEHKKMTMELEDLQNKMRDIQSLKVTREIQSFLNEVDHESKKAQEVAILEQTLVMQKQHHERNVNEKKKSLKDLKKTIKERLDENSDLTRDLEGLNVSVNERRQIHEVNADKRSDAGRDKRYKEIVQRRKLVELAKAQAQEVAVLRAEVERLRMRTFPALVQVEH